MRSKLLFIILLALLISVLPVLGGCGGGKSSPSSIQTTPTVETATPTTTYVGPEVTVGGGTSGGVVTTPPTATPEGQTPPPACISEAEARQIVLDYVFNTYGATVDDLLEGSPSGSWNHYPTIDLWVWETKVIVKPNMDGAFIGVDCSGNVHDIVEVQESERQARNEADRTKYGKFMPDLYEILQTKSPEDMIPVQIFVPKLGQSLEAIAEQIIDKYPEAHLGPGVTPTKDTPLDLYEQIWQEYNEAIKQDQLTSTQPLIDLLRSMGYEAKPSRVPWLKAIDTTLPKRVLLDVAEREEVGIIHSRYPPTVTLALNYAAPTLGAPAVWNRGITGTGEKIGIIDGGTVVANHPYLSSVIVLGTPNTQSDHPAMVAGSAASIYSTHKGMAQGATIVSGDLVPDYQGMTYDIHTGGADIINCSWTLSGDVGIDGMKVLDRFYDKFVRVERTSITACAGNYPDELVWSPGKGYNVITVGGIFDQNNGDWRDDAIWFEDAHWGSAYLNPQTDPDINRRLEKPEVVAVAREVTTLQNANPNNLITGSGTSFATPMVAGEVALLFNRQGALEAIPETVKAIAMASAAHNIEGDRDSPYEGDIKDGAGAVHIGMADIVARDITWHGSGIYMDSSFDANGWYNNQDFQSKSTFRAYTGQRIRTAIAWDSWVDGLLTQDILRTDLDLYLFKVGNPYPVASSAGMRNSFELIDYLVQEPGEYTIKVKKYSSTEDSNYLGVAWVLPGYQRHIQAGTNLISLPVNPEAQYMASTLLGEINSQGGNATEIYKWTGGTWQAYILGWPTPDYQIQRSVGYLLNAGVASTWIIQGSFPSEPDWGKYIAAGMNLIGLPIQPNTPFIASTLMADMNYDGRPSANVTQVSRWEGGGWQSYPDSGVNFDIEMGRAYFIKDQGTAFTWWINSNP